MSTPGPVVKGILRMAGTAMNDFLPKLLNVGGKVGQKAATGALDAGKRTFSPGLVGKAAAETPELLRSGSRSTIPVAGKLLGQAGALGGAVLLGSMLDQQTENTQSSQGGMDDFLQSQALQNQKFMHEMMLIQNRAESRTPGSQYGGMLKNIADYEKTLTDAGEITNREVLGVARSIYGTGFRA